MFVTSHLQFATKTIVNKSFQLQAIELRELFPYKCALVYIDSTQIFTLGLFTLTTNRPP